MPAFNKREPAAFEAVYHHFAESLTYFADELVHDKQAAEDISAETLVKAFNKSSDFPSMEKLKAYLYITASNAALDHLRKQKRHHRIHSRIRYESEEQTEDVELAYIRAEVSQAIQDAIEALPPQARQVIKMAFVDGKGLGEIAEALNLSYNTVRNYKGRGLELMRIHLIKNKLISGPTLLIALTLINK